VAHENKLQSTVNAMLEALNIGVSTGSGNFCWRLGFHHISYAKKMRGTDDVGL